MRASSSTHPQRYPQFRPYQRFSQVMFVAGDGAKWQPRGSGKWARAAFQGGDQHRLQGRAGLWSGRASGLRSWRHQPSEQSCAFGCPLHPAGCWA